MTGKIAYLNPGKDEKAGVVRNQVNIALALLSRPPDKPVPGAQMPGRGAEGKAGNRTLISEYQILQLFAYRMAVTQVMVLIDQAVVQLLKT